MNKGLSKMKRNQKITKRVISGSYTFASERALTDHLVDAYCDYIEMKPEDSFHLYFQFDFLDTRSQVTVFGLCRLILAYSEKNSAAEFKITFMYDWQDSSMEELGTYIEEIDGTKVKLYQIDCTEQKGFTAVA